MSIPISLLQMPKIPMENIFEYLDFHDILVLRKVCHDLSNFIDDTKPASHLTGIGIYVHAQSISFILNQPRSSFSIRVYYMKSREGCLVKWKKEGNVEETTLENKEYLTVFCKDFDIVLRHQKTVLEEFKIYFNSSNSTDMERVLERLYKYLKSMNHLLQVKSLHIRVENCNEILSILPLMNPKSLKNIHIYESSRKNNVLNFDEIGQLEQWKQAKELSIGRFQFQNLAQNCQHFSRITFNCRPISTEELILLKEMFLCSTTLNTMEMCNYRNLSRDAMRQTLIELFGQPCGDRYQERYWFFRIPDTNQLLKITLEYYYYIYFNRVEQSDVPQNAIILN